MLPPGELYAIARHCETHGIRIVGEDRLQQQSVQVAAMNLQHRHAVLLDHLPNLDNVEDRACGVAAGVAPRHAA